MLIREYAEARDRDGLRRCAIELQNFERTIDPRMPDGASIADPYLEQMFVDLRRNAGKVFVAIDENAVIGYACVWARTRPDDVSEAPQEYALVTELVVLASHRELGIGRSLLRAAVSYAKEQGSSCVRISVLAENDAARALYRSEGFENREITLEMALSTD